MMTEDLVARIDAMERRLRAAEDQLAILHLIASYGPAVDGLDREGVAHLWAENGSYDFGGTVLKGREAVADLIYLDTHKAYVAQGCSHALTMPRIDIDGDRAVAVNYSQVFVKESWGWRADRTGSNRWELERTPDGWKVTSRVARQLDGNEAPRALLQRP